MVFGAMAIKLLFSAVIFLWVVTESRAAESRAVKKILIEDIHSCVNYMACILKSKENLQSIFREFGVKAKAKFYSSLHEITGNPKSATPEFWDVFPDILCNEDKDDVFSKWGMTLADFWSNSCENGDKEECDKYEKAMNVLAALGTKYKAQGKCGESEAKGMAGGMKPPAIG